jgi:hypothetical protein
MTDPATVIEKLHQVAQLHGYMRARLDREVLGPLMNPTAWVEIGYGCGEVCARFSDGVVFKFTAHSWDDKISAAYSNLLYNAGTRGRNGTTK